MIYCFTIIILVFLAYRMFFYLLMGRGDEPFILQRGDKSMKILLLLLPVLVMFGGGELY